MLSPGTAIQRYVVESLIGEGGMGAVYRARDTHLDRAVALKVLTQPDAGALGEEGRERLVREARAAAALSHPNAVSIYDAGDSEHGPFIVMELVEGETLRGRIERGATTAEILDWMKHAARALAEAHDRGIVHRDIKPENLMVRRDGIAKVLDFGIARSSMQNLDPSAPTQAALPTLTGTGVQIGTPQYMAPEQIKGKKLDGRADQFAWAVTTYEALAGRSPWHAENGALGIVASILEEQPPPISTVRSDVPEHVSVAVARAMSKRPDDRFATMHDLVRALDGQPVSERAPSSPSPRFDRAPEPLRAAPPAAPRSNETRFSEATMKAVIGKALAFQERGGYSRGELTSAADELGIPSDALAEALASLKVDRQRAASMQVEEEARRQILRRRRHGFWNHLIAYFCVNLIIVGVPLLNAHVGRNIWGVFVPAVAWGIGLLMHALKAFSKEVSGAEIRRHLAKEEHAIAKDAARRAALVERLEKRARRERLRRGAAELGTAVENGVAVALQAAAQKIRERTHEPPVGGPPASPGVRVGEPPRARVADGPSAPSARTQAEHQAEVEAGAFEEERGRARR